MIGPADFGITAGDLSRDLPQRWRVDITSPDYVFEGQDSGLETVQITFDASRAPRCDAIITAAIDPVTADLIVPGPEVHRNVTVWAAYGDGPYVNLANLRLQDAIYEAGRLTMRAASAEVPIIEAAEQPTPYVPAPQQQAATLIWDLLGAGDSFVLLANPEGLTGQTLTLEAVDNVWDAMLAIAAGEGWRMYSPCRDTGEGTLEIRRTPTGNEPPAVSLRTGDGGTVSRVSRSQSRTLYATEVAVIYEWTTPDGLEYRVQAVATAANALGNIRRVTYRHATPATQTQATAAAQAYLHRHLARLTSHDVTAINAFWVRPDMVAELDTPTGAGVFEQLVDRVTFTSAGVMTVTTRSIPDWWSIGDALTAYPTIAAHRAAFATIEAAKAGPSN